MPSNPEVPSPNVENLNNELPQYKKVELGDNFAATQQNTQQQQVQQTQSQQSQQPNDPTAFWNYMSNTGYKPSIRLIQNVTTLLSNGNTDWSDTWFSVLFQKIVKKVKQPAQGKVK